MEDGGKQHEQHFFNPPPPYSMLPQILRFYKDYGTKTVFMKKTERLNSDI